MIDLDLARNTIYVVLESKIPIDADLTKCGDDWDWEQIGICENCPYYYVESHDNEEPYVVSCLIEGILKL